MHCKKFGLVNRPLNKRGIARRGSAERRFFCLASPPRFFMSLKFFGAPSLGG